MIRCMMFQISVESCIVLAIFILIQMIKGFWEKLERPIIGLSPMDGVTDGAFRYMVCKYSQPALTMTEFTNVEGLARGASQMMEAFVYREIERPAVAQIYGVEVESFYKCTLLMCALGFDGVDINMGCPANKVAKRGSGAALIKTPALAKKIVRACQKAAKDWAEGMTLEEGGVAPECIAEAKRMNERRAELDGVASEVERVEIPVSVKTRVGFDEIVAEEWAKHLLEVRPANITMHGRTLRQMYLGLADWGAIERAARVCDGSGVSFLGNGDVKTMGEAREWTEQYGLDGVLVGRATFGSPWFFGGKVPDMETVEGIEQMLKVVVEHAQYYEEHMSTPFHVIRKHLAWYCKGFEGAKELRMALMRVDDSKGVQEVVENFEFKG